jgi:Flp pilus assembly protein TadG
MTAYCQNQVVFVGTLPSRRSLRTDRRAGMAVLIALLFPALIAMGLLAVDAVRAYSQASLVSYATQMAALAGSGSLGNYYSLGASRGGSAISTQAATIGDANAASSADLSAVIQATTRGTWNSSSATFTSLATSGSTAPNAVQVVGQTILSTYFGGAFGTPTITITKSAVASLGMTRPFNVIVLNDMGGPNPNQSLGFPGAAQDDWWAQQQAADLAILNCIGNSGNAASQFGVTGFLEQGYTLQPLMTVNSGTNATTISNNINNVGSANFQYCRESKGAHQCHGSNVAGAIYSAISQFSGASYVGANNHIVILTNELPVYDPTVAKTVYTLAMGTGVTVSGSPAVGTGSSATALCGSSPVCTSANLQQMAEGQAAAAGAAVTGGRSGITISTVYFSGDTNTPSGKAASYATEIATWVKNRGLALTTSSLAGVATQAATVCKMIGATPQLSSL